MGGDAITNMTSPALIACASLVRTSVTIPSLNARTGSVPRMGARTNAAVTGSGTCTTTEAIAGTAKRSRTNAAAPAPAPGGGGRRRAGGPGSSRAPRQTWRGRPRRRPSVGHRQLLAGEVVVEALPLHELLVVALLDEQTFF